MKPKPIKIVTCDICQKPLEIYSGMSVLQKSHDDCIIATEGQRTGRQIDRNKLDSARMRKAVKEMKKRLRARAITWSTKDGLKALWKRFPDIAEREGLPKP